MELAEKEGAYETRTRDRPLPRGQLQYDMWGVTPSDRWDWAGLKEKIAQHGMRNSLLMALRCPRRQYCADSGQQREHGAVHVSNMYNRRVLAGEFTIVNKHLLRDLTARRLLDRAPCATSIIANRRIHPERGRRFPEGHPRRVQNRVGDPPARHPGHGRGPRTRTSARARA